MGGLDQRTNYGVVTGVIQCVLRLLLILLLDHWSVTTPHNMRVNVASRARKGQAPSPLLFVIPVRYIRLSWLWHPFVVCPHNAKGRPWLREPSPKCYVDISLRTR